jgi:hypothetical protein
VAQVVFNSGGVFVNGFINYEIQASYELGRKSGDRCCALRWLV